jgi:glutathione S-transferase
MKLYYAPGSCALSPHIVALEAGVPIELDRVDFATRKTASGDDLNKVNPKGYVPALRLDNGEVLTEGPAIVQYLADRNPGAGLAPAAGTLERYRLQEWLNFIGTELHKNFSPLFKPDTPDDYKPVAIRNIVARLGTVDQHLSDHKYLLGNAFTAADAYLFTVTNWTQHVGIDLTPFASLRAYRERIAARPHVQAAMKAEGLLG